MASAPPCCSMSRDRVFYTKEYTRKVDGVFIRALVEQTIQGNLVIHGAPNRSSIMFGRSKVNMQFGLAYIRKGDEEFDNLQYLFMAAHESDSGEDEREVINISSDPDGTTFSGDEVDDGHNNAFSYDLAWYTRSSLSDNTSSSFSSFNGASSNVKKSFGKRLSTRCPPVPRGPSGSRPSYVASSSHFKKG